MTDLNLLGTSQVMPATSGTWNFSVTRDDIVRQAMMNLGLLAENELPTAQEVTDCARVLNMMVKQLAGGMDRAPGFKMFQRHRGTLFLGASKYLYNLGSQGDYWCASTKGLTAPQAYNSVQLNTAAAAGSTSLFVNSTNGVNVGDFVGIQVGSDLFWTTVSSVVANTAIVIPAPGLSGFAALGAQVFSFTTKAQRPVAILTAVLRDIYGSDTPMTLLTLQEYESLPNKVQPTFQSDPTAIYYEPQMANNVGTLRIDCAGAQDVTKVLHIVYLREAMDFNNPGDAPEFPQEWFLHLSWELSLQICGMFDADWTQDRQEAYVLATTRAREANPQDTREIFQVDE